MIKVGQKLKKYYGNGKSASDYLYEIVRYSPKTIIIKRLEPESKNDIRESLKAFKERLDKGYWKFVIEKPKRESKNQYFLKIAKLVASRATCPRRSVGCVIVNKFNHIKATGYNGVPKNYAHCIDIPCGGQDSKSSEGLNSCMATHAEQNALLQCDNVMDIHTIYITTSPCITCAKLIANTGCQEVIYSQEYSDKSGIEMLNKLGIKTKLEEINE